MQAMMCLILRRNSLIPVTVGTQAMPFLDREEFETHQETIDANEVERPSDTVNSEEQRVEVDVHEHCKYRSTDIHNAAIGGEKLPMDTVKAMFKVESLVTLFYVLLFLEPAGLLHLSEVYFIKSC